MQRHVYASTHVDVPFERVQEFLRDDPARVLGEPGPGGAGDLHSRELEVHAGPVTIHDRFAIELEGFDAFSEHHYCRLQVRLHGDRHHLLIPDVQGVLEASDAGADRTQLALIGHYRPRMGAVGALEDALVGHRAVEEALTQMLEDLKARLQVQPGPAPRPQPAARTEPAVRSSDLDADDGRQERSPHTAGRR